MRFSLFRRAYLLVPIALLAVLFFVADPAASFRRLADAEMGPVLAALGLVQIQIVLAALRWHLTATSIGQTLGMRRAIGEYYGASLLNLTLPGGVSGDVLRVVRNRQGFNRGVDWERSAQAVMLERASGQVAFAGVTVAAMFLWGSGGAASMPEGTFQELKVLAYVAIACAAALGVIVLVGRRWGKGAVGRFWRALRLAFLRPREATLQFALSLAVVAAYIATFSLASRAVGAPLDLRQSLMLIPPVLLTMILPVSVGGWGVRESAAAAMWPLAGLSPAEGIAASVLYGLVSTAGALPGLIAFVFPSPDRPHSGDRGDHGARPPGADGRSRA